MKLKNRVKIRSEMNNFSWQSVPVLARHFRLDTDHSGFTSLVKEVTKLGLRFGISVHMTSLTNDFISQ